MVAHTGFGNYLAARSDTGGLYDHDTGAMPDPRYSVPVAWYRAARNAIVDWRRVKGGEPTAAQKKILAQEIGWIKEGIRQGAEVMSEHHHMVLSFYIKNGRLPTGYPNHTGENGGLVQKAIATVNQHRDAYAAKHRSIWDDIGQAASFIAKPVTALGSAASHIASGDNVLQSLKTGVTEAISPVTGTLKALSPALNVAAGLASVIPGLGTVAGTALSMAAAVGRGASLGDLALAAARGALPGGAIAKVAFDVAVGVATHQSPAGIALAQIRDKIPGGDVGKAAFDAGLAVAYHAKPHEAAHAAAALPKGKARETFARPVLAAARIRKAPPALLHKMIRKERAHTRARPLSRRARSWVGRALKSHATRRLDTKGLGADGKTYIVERGDSAWRIAQNLTGDGNHHVYELLRANSPPKTLVRNGYDLASGTTNLVGANFKYLKTGEVLRIPAAWIGKFVRVTAQAAPPPPGGDLLSLPSPEKIPVVQPAPAAPVSMSPVVPIPIVPPAPLPPVADPAKAAPSAERDDPAAIAQAKSILVAWEHTDGAAAAGLPDYGGNAADQSPIWGERDAWELRAFVVWSNAHGTTLSLLGDLTQAKLDALVAWAENRAKQIATGEGSVSPTGIVTPAPAGSGSTVASGPSPIPVDAGPSVLPPGAAPQTMQAGIIPTEIIPDTNISGSPDKKGGGGFGFGLAAIALLGIGIAFSENGRRKAAA